MSEPVETRSQTLFAPKKVTVKSFQCVVVNFELQNEDSHRQAQNSMELLSNQNWWSKSV